MNLYLHEVHLTSTACISFEFYMNSNFKKNRLKYKKQNNAMEIFNSTKPKPEEVHEPCSS